MLSLFAVLRAAGKVAAVAYIASSIWAAAGQACAMTFEKTTNAPGCAERTCILASGIIDKSSADDLDAFIRAERIKPGSLVILDSAGGVVLYSLPLGERIRRAQLDTSVSGGVESSTASRRECASACVFSFMGGVHRSVGDGGRIGVHQIYSNPMARDALSVADAEWLASEIAMHDQKMGGTVGILVLALRTSPNAIHWFTARELTSLGVTTPPGTPSATVSSLCE